MLTAARPPHSSALWTTLALLAFGSGCERASNRDTRTSTPPTRPAPTAVVPSSTNSPGEGLLVPLLSGYDLSFLVENFGKSTTLRKTICPGDPHVGSILWLKQVHQSALSSQDSAIVAEYQAAMLRSLVDHRPAHVFVEQLRGLGGIARIHPEFDPSNIRSRVRVVFPNRTVPQTLTSEQLQYLEEYPAAIIYAALEDGVTLHPTLDDDADKHIFEMEAALAGLIERGLDVPERLLAELKVMHEQAAMREVFVFLREHPGTDVALTFGIGHIFGEHGDCQAAIVSEAWPGIMIKIRPMLEDLFRRTHGQDDLQVALIGSCDYVPSSVFGSLCAKAQELAITSRKLLLIGSPETPSAAAVIARLKAEARSDEVRALLDKEATP